MECNGTGGATPATLVQFMLHHDHTNFSSYNINLVENFNIPMTVTPHKGKGKYPVVSCQANLLDTCPVGLKFRSHGNHGPIVGCKSECEAFKTYEPCYKNHYNNAQTCKVSTYLEFFKHACLATFTYAHNIPSLMHECLASHELKVIFCH